jgi:hypothetical protein
LGLSLTFSDQRKRCRKGQHKKNSGRKVKHGYLQSTPHRASIYELVGELSMNSSLTPTCRCGKRLSGFTTKWSLKLDCARRHLPHGGAYVRSQQLNPAKHSGVGQRTSTHHQRNPRNAAESVAYLPHLLRYAVRISDEESSEPAPLRVEGCAGRRWPATFATDAPGGGGVGRPQYFGRRCDVFFAVVLADTVDIDANAIG